MQYIILSDGKGSRWNNYMGITKQEAIIDGERIIDRTCRLLRDNNQKDVKVFESLYIKTKNNTNSDEW